jgi:dienelactone hydrolase
LKNQIPKIIIALIIIGLAIPPAHAFSNFENDNVILQLENKEKDHNEIQTFWKQIIGDSPNCDLCNGFNNPFNVNIRGKTTFNFDDQEYIFYGTGNVKNSISNSICYPAEIFPLALSLSNNFQLVDSVVFLLDIYFKNLKSQGCEIWYYNGSSWGQTVGCFSEAIISSGFNNPNNAELTILIPYTISDSGIQYLYAGTWNQQEGCEIWRTTDPFNGIWEPVIHKNGKGIFSNGFGNKNNAAAYSAVVFNDWLYIGTMNWWNGCEIWRTNGTTWEKVIGSGDSISGLKYGFGDDKNGFERDIYAWEMEVYNNQLYVGTFNIAGCELWRTEDAINWECLVGEKGILKRGFNTENIPINSHNYGIRRMEVYNNSLYIGTASTPPFMINISQKNIPDPSKSWSKTFSFYLSKGCEIWKYNGSNFKVENQGIYKKQKISGFGDPTNAYIWSLTKFDNRLFAGTMNPGTYVFNITIIIKNSGLPSLKINFETEENGITKSAGCEIWYTQNNNKWYQLVGDEINNDFPLWPANGFNDKNNLGARALLNYSGKLFVGVMNSIEGCEVWSFTGEKYPDTEINKIKTKDKISSEKEQRFNQIKTYFNSSGFKLYTKIFYPLNETETYPCIVFCEGLPAYISAYSWIPKALAENGYVVIIYDPPDLGNSDGYFQKRGISIPFLNLYFRFGSYFATPLHYFKNEWKKAAKDALTYMLNESPVKHLINSSSIGIIGHSLGGITATEVAAEDNRFQTVIAMSHGSPLVIKEIKIPIQFIAGTSDLGLYSVPIILSDYWKANTPKELIMIQLGTHYGFTTTFRSLCPCPPWQKEIILKYVNAWFDYFLKNKQEAYSTITNSTAHLSKTIKSRYNFGEGNIYLN